MQSESHPDEAKIDRSESWVLARMDEEGNFLDDAVAEKAKEIVSYLLYMHKFITYINRLVFYMGMAQDCKYMVLLIL
jgi:hypothetical protein